MLVSNLLRSPNNYNTVQFCATEAPVKQNSADILINTFHKKSAKQYEQRKLFLLPTACMLSLLGLFVYISERAYKFSRLKKDPTVTKEMIKKFRHNVLGKNLPLGCLGVLAISYIAGSIAKKSYDKNLEEQKNLFNSLNTTHAVLSDKIMSSKMIQSGQYNAINGEIQINQNTILDPWLRFKNKYILKHELVHAKQYEMIARSEDGIKKLNYAIVMSAAKKVKRKQYLMTYFDMLYKDITSDNTNKYDVEVPLDGAQVNFKDYIIAIHTLCHDENITYNDIPIVINQKHYQKVRDESPELTDAEKEQAEIYYNAVIDYPIFNVFKALNPFSSYYKNPLEKEAYKENPWYTRII